MYACVCARSDAVSQEAAEAKKKAWQEELAARTAAQKKKVDEALRTGKMPTPKISNPKPPTGTSAAAAAGAAPTAAAPMPVVNVSMAESVTLAMPAAPSSGGPSSPRTNSAPPGSTPQVPPLTPLAPH